MEYTYLDKFFHCFYGTNRYIFGIFTLSDLHGKILEAIFDIRGALSYLGHRPLIRSAWMSISRIAGNTQRRNPICFYHNDFFLL